MVSEGRRTRARFDRSAALPNDSRSDRRIFIHLSTQKYTKIRHLNTKWRHLSANKTFIGHLTALGDANLRHLDRKRRDLSGIYTPFIRDLYAIYPPFIRLVDGNAIF